MATIKALSIDDFLLDACPVSPGIVKNIVIMF